MLEALGLDSCAEQVYRQMLAHPAWGLTDLSRDLALPEDSVRAALDRLLDLALLRESVDRPGQMHAVSPEAGLHAALARQQADLARHQQQVAESQTDFLRLLGEYAGGRTASSKSEIEQLLGMDAVHERLERLAREASDEILAFMTNGAQSAQAIEAAMRNDEQVLSRGVTICTIGLDSIRNDAATLRYAQFISARGAQFRTAPVLPPRMIVIDRSSALMPIDPANTRRGALYVTGAGVVTSLVALFEQVWELAVPLGTDRAPDMEGLTAQERTILKLLAQGLTDERTAGKLGVSAITVRRSMAGLMDRLGARSRFEAGLKASQRGWL